MKKICAWCKKDLGEVDIPGYGEDVHDDGICKECGEKLVMLAKHWLGEHGYRMEGEK